MTDVYWDDVKYILEIGVDCMKIVPIGTDDGVVLVDLTDYMIVKRLHQVIAAAINAWERDADGQWKRNAAGNFIPTKAHSMPPGGPLPVENVNAFLAWVDDGMPEAPAVA